MTTKEAAALWGVMPATVRRYCAAGKIKHCKKVKGKWVLNPLCHKPFDRRFKKPTIVLSSVVRRFNFGGSVDVIEERFPPLVMPKDVCDGLVVGEELDIQMAA